MSDSTTPAQEEKKGDTGYLGGLISGKTPGVRNIEAAYSRAGASNHHTSGAATKLGSQEQVGTNEAQGVGSQKFADRISDQRREPSVIGKMFNNLINGTDNTK
ncbi:hypothetical protein EG329_014030 [Mollisiaceae sp. DMI_Dod_QoI]|nr:hypothetical protein EG329_014030 [Helotiales sp. DMI_Dod_QoI]